MYVVINGGLLPVLDGGKFRQGRDVFNGLVGCGTQRFGFHNRVGRRNSWPRGHQVASGGGGHLLIENLHGLSLHVDHLAVIATVEASSSCMHSQALSSLARRAYSVLVWS